LFCKQKQNRKFLVYIREIYYLIGRGGRIVQAEGASQPGGNKPGGKRAKVRTSQRVNEPRDESARVQNGKEAKKQ